MSRTSINQLRAVSVAETLTYENGVVDLWYYFYEGIDTELLNAHMALLTASERDRHASFKLDRDRHAFLATRALVRTVLSTYSTVPPADWRFATNEHGKPRISNPTITPTIHFNLANTRGLVACAVSIAHEPLGVDAELIDSQVDAIGLADRYFSASETSRLRALPSCEQSERFFAYWTLKESYIKARGFGLALPLDKFSFLDDEEISVEFNPSLADDAASWRFALIDASPCHMVAISVRTGGAALSLRATRVVPLRGKAEQT